MEISNDGTAAIDYVKYFTKQLPLELARMAQLKDELEKRQGAMTAVEATLADRKQAREELDLARAEAGKIMDLAKADANAAAQKKAVQDAREKQLDEREADFDTYARCRESEISAKEANINSVLASNAARAASLDAKEKALDADRANLEARIKAFQNKVASLDV